VVGRTYVVASTRRNVGRHISTFSSALSSICKPSSMKTLRSISRYISSHLKKLQHVTVRAFFTRVEQLNNYVKYLPSIYNSPKATESTKLAVPYTEVQLAVQLLCMCPVHWQNQYDLNQNTIPQDTCRLLTVLENIGWPSLRKPLRSVLRLLLVRRSTTTVVVVIPTPNRKSC
jgi:hypothetical protein